MEIKDVIEQFSVIVRKIVGESEERIRKDILRVESDVKLLHEDVANINLLLGRLSSRADRHSLRIEHLEDQLDLMKSNK